MVFFTTPSSQNLGLRWMWLYFAVTVPLTLLIYLIWTLWKRKGLQKKSLQIPDDVESQLVELLEELRA